METYIDEDEERVITLNQIIHACREHIMEEREKVS